MGKALHGRELMLRKLPNEEPCCRKKPYLTFTEEKVNGCWEKTSRKVSFGQVLEGKDPSGGSIPAQPWPGEPSRTMCKSLVLLELCGDSPFLQVSSGTKDFRTTLASRRKICPFALLHGPSGKIYKVRNVLLGQSYGVSGPVLPFKPRQQEMLLMESSRLRLLPVVHTLVSPSTQSLC